MRAKGFCYVVIGAEFQAHHFLGFLRLCRQHQYRRASSISPQLPADFEAVFSRKHYVEHNQIELRLRCPARGIEAIAGDLNFVAFQFEVVFQAKSDGGFVFGDENASHLFPPCTGKSIVNSLPWPRVLARVISPP